MITTFSVINNLVQLVRFYIYFLEIISLNFINLKTIKNLHDH